MQETAPGGTRRTVSGSFLSLFSLPLTPYKHKHPVFFVQQIRAGALIITVNCPNSYIKNIEYLPVIYLTNTMQQLYQAGKKLISENPALLIKGEKGTGKELLARSLHHCLSSTSPFLTISCVNLPFDHFEERIDACTRDIRDINPADTAITLFLRDICCLDMEVQMNLIELLKKRFIEKHAHTANNYKINLLFSFSGGKTYTDSATHTEINLKTILNTASIQIAPLRERKNDISPLATFFVDTLSKEYSKEIGKINTEAMNRLMAYDWPGNVSELRDVIENAVMLSESPILCGEDIRFNVSKKSIALESFLSREDFFSLSELENIYVNTVLKRLNYNKTKAAKVLGVSRNTLQRKISGGNLKPDKPADTRKKTQQPSFF